MDAAINYTAAAVLILLVLGRNVQKITMAQHSRETLKAPRSITNNAYPENMTRLKKIIEPRKKPYIPHPPVKTKKTDGSACVGQSRK